MKVLFRIRCLQLGVLPLQVVQGDLAVLVMCLMTILGWNSAPIGTDHLQPVSEELHLLGGFGGLGSSQFVRCLSYFGGGDISDAL